MVRAKPLTLIPPPRLFSIRHDGRQGWHAYCAHPLHNNGRQKCTKDRALSFHGGDIEETQRVLKRLGLVGFSAETRAVHMEVVWNDAALSAPAVDRPSTDELDAEVERWPDWASVLAAYAA